MITKQVINELFDEWFFRRFVGHTKDMYYDIWKGRFNTGKPEQYMDFSGKAIWIQVLKERTDKHLAENKPFADVFKKDVEKTIDFMEVLE